MRVRLTRKLAAQIDDVDLKGREVGDVFDLPPLEARLLLAEEWAVLERRATDRPRQDSPQVSTASDCEGSLVHSRLARARSLSHL